MTDLSAKTCLVTGSTGGVGLATACILAEQGAELILVGRNARKGARSVAAVRRAAGHDRVAFVQADLSAMAEVRALADRVAADYGQLDILVNNAGGLFMRRRESVDGLEYTFALNHLAYFLLTAELLDLLKAAPAARVVNVSSGVHRGVALDFDDLQGLRHYDGWLAYRRSKLMNLMFTYALARRLDVNGINVNGFHPGFVRSGFGHDNRGLAGLGLRLAQLISGIPPRQGACTAVYLATSDRVAGISGEYFEKSQNVESSPESRVVDDQERLWRASEVILAGLALRPPATAATTTTNVSEGRPQ